jgi:DNA-binding beta-propeller fold protein YncE
MLVDMPGNPFLALPTNDGCWVFVSITSGNPRRRGGIAVLRRSGGTIRVARVIPLEGNPTGMVLTHRDSLLVVATGNGIAFIDVSRAKTGRGKPLLGLMRDGNPGAGRIYAATTGDGTIAFISDERSESITVVDLAKAVSNGFSRSAIVGRIPVGNDPVGLAISPDGKSMFTVSQSVPAALGWPSVCRPEGTAGSGSPDHSRGAIIIVDVARASADPRRGVESAFPAGCNTVRIVLSPDGERAYVSSRGTNDLLVFDTQRLRTDTAHALVAVVPVGTAPVGIAVIDSGRKVIVTSSNRFGAPTDPQDLTVVDATRVSEGRGAVIGSISVGAFPRELRVTADGRTLLLTNFGSQSLQVIDINRLPIRPPVR